VPVAGVVVAGVSGSPLRIGGVVVPASWAAADHRPYAVDAAWLAGAVRLASSRTVALERCTTVRGDPVCLGFDPAIVVGGAGGGRGRADRGRHGDRRHARWLRCQRRSWRFVAGGESHRYLARRDVERWESR